MLCSELRLHFEIFSKNSQLHIQSSTLGEESPGNAQKHRDHDDIVSCKFLSPQIFDVLPFHSFFCFDGHFRLILDQDNADDE